jgi:[acyl-carrier-protein] S-malonyltransferase
VKKAYIFPGQGSQFSGMGKDLYENNPKAKDLFEKANEILGFRLTDIMFGGTDDELKQTKVTQPAIFTHSAVLALVSEIKPDMVAGHSLGEFSALVANGVLDFESALKLVYQRALAMQEACEANPSTMAAVLGLDDDVVEKACASIKNEVVVPANYNCQGQLVISGSHEGINLATEKLKEAGAKRVLPLQVGGAFHSPLMESARQKLATAIENTHFNAPSCPIYQNVNAQPANDVATIKANLIAQLTGAVRWTQCVQNMVQDGAISFTEVGAGKVLQGLVKKIHKDAEVQSL